jgi:hypothetical protein
MSWLTSYAIRHRYRRLCAVGLISASSMRDFTGKDISAVGQVNVGYPASAPSHLYFERVVVSAGALQSQRGRVRLISPKGNDFTSRFPFIAMASLP